METETAARPQYRHEWKHELNRADLITLRQRLRAVMKPDPHAVNGVYTIRSLYFDNLRDKALREKLDGVNRREKFRVRYYNGVPDPIHLEKKSKWNSLGTKESAVLTRDEAQALAEGRTDWMRAPGMEETRPLVSELYRKMTAQGLRPRTIVDYTREPFVFGPGNVRVTFDYDIRTGLGGVDFLNPDCATIPARDAPMILEVKWDAFLPEIIRDAVTLPGRRAAAFSKYAACRMYD